MLGPDGNPVFSSSGMTPGHDSSPTNIENSGGPMGMRPNGPQMMGPRGPMMGPGGPGGPPGGPMGGPGNRMGPGGMMGPGPGGPGPGPGGLGGPGDQMGNSSMPPSSSAGGTFTTVPSKSQVAPAPSLATKNLWSLVVIRMCWSASVMTIQQPIF